MTEGAATEDMYISVWWIIPGPQRPCMAHPGALSAHAGAMTAVWLGRTDGQGGARSLGEA